MVMLLFAHDTARAQQAEATRNATKLVRSGSGPLVDPGQFPDDRWRLGEAPREPRKFRGGR
jgi:hypothetical protein